MTEQTATEKQKPAADKSKAATKVFPHVTQKGNVRVTEFADGTVHYNALGAGK